MESLEDRGRGVVVVDEEVGGLGGDVLQVKRVSVTTLCDEKEEKRTVRAPLVESLRIAFFKALGERGLAPVTLGRLPVSC